MSKKAIILFTVFIDIAGLGIIIPVLPFYVRSFGTSDQVVTWLFAAYSLCSLVSSPLLGALSDRLGRRPILIISLFSTALGWLVFASARSVTFLFVGRIIDGLAAGNLTTAQGYLSDMSASPKERTANLGLIGAMFGLALVVGPLLGGLLGSLSHTLPFWVVGFMALINTVLAYFNLPETLAVKIQGPIYFNPLRPIISGFRDKMLWPGFLAWGLFGTAVAIQNSIFALFLSDAFKLNEFHTGLILTLVGLTLALNQGVLLKRFWIRHFKEPDLELYLLLVLVMGFILMGGGWKLFALGMLLITFSQSVLRAVMNSQLAGVYPLKQGEVLGTMNSVMSLSMIFGPLLAGSLFVKDIHAPFWAAAFIGLAAFVVVLAKRRLLAQINPDPEAPESLAM